VLFLKASWGSGLGIPRWAGRILSARLGPTCVRALVSRVPTAAGPAGDTTLHPGPDQRNEACDALPYGEIAGRAKVEF
jgi:hypothetical protein